MSLINCKINIILTLSANAVLFDTDTTQTTAFAITDTKCYVLVLTLSIQDKAAIEIRIQTHK